MFSKSLDQIQFEDIDQFCRTGIREGILLDYKEAFPERLEKAIAAFANTYGGHILIGVGEEATGAPSLPIIGVPLQPGLRERVVSIGLQAISPPVFPDVKVVEFCSSDASGQNDRAVVFVRVAESDASAHAVNGGKDVYIRVDNISELNRRATIGEIEWFANKRKKCTDLKSQLLENAKSHADQFLIRLRAHHKWSTIHPRCRLVCWASPVYPRTELSSPENLLRDALLHRVQVGNMTSAFPHSSPVPVQGGVRFPDYFTPRFAYTEISSFGLVYYDVGMSFPDAPVIERINCETVLLVLIATLKYSLRLYEALGYFGLVEIGLSLKPATNLYPFTSHSFADRFVENRSMEHEITLQITGTVKDLNETWMEKSKDAYKEFLWSFGLDMRRDQIDADFANWGLT